MVGTPMKEQPVAPTSETDWLALESMTDDQIDTSDIPAIPPDRFAHALIRRDLPIPVAHQPGKNGRCQSSICNPGIRENSRVLSQWIPFLEWSLLLHIREVWNGSRETVEKDLCCHGAFLAMRLSLFRFHFQITDKIQHFDRLVGGNRRTGRNAAILVGMPPAGRVDRPG